MFVGSVYQSLYSTQGMFVQFHTWCTFLTATGPKLEDFKACRPSGVLVRHAVRNKESGTWTESSFAQEDLSRHHII